MPKLFKWFRTTSFIFQQTKKDIREFQLSKSAITEALDCLLQDKEVKRVYLSGGFLKSIDIEDCIRLGIFSRLWKDKVSISGNTALRGI
ncbi:ASKHA domain-containing protein [Faecalitalea cylindroides]|uniref:ASKHA domain-containing protein n=1 Tax=Faecalitalea cylindroides TaxID=39483 RepID=UPI0022E28C8D|nr:ASKHA domain-containing protein [Faecalitalea cylindroides]